MSVRAPLRLSESAETAALSVTHAPIGKGGKNWVTRTAPANTGQLPAYIQNIRNALIRNGKDESSATAIAVGTVKRWAAGGGGVHAEVRAAAAKAVAEWEALKAKSGAEKVAEATVGQVRDAEQSLRSAALARIAVLEQQLGQDGLVALLAEGMLAEAASWAPTLKRTASASNEVSRHEVYDGGQHVGTLAVQRGYGPKEPDRHTAFTINGQRLGSMASKGDAVQALRKHLEEAPARVIAVPSLGKHLVARPESYSGQTSYMQYSTEQAARQAAGLPAAPTQPELDAKVTAVAEMLRFDLVSLDGLDVPPLRRVQEARRADPFDLIAEGFSSGELRDFRGKWEKGGEVHRFAKLTPRDVPGQNTRVGRPKPAAQTRYEGGVTRASAAARTAHAAKPQIAPKQPKDGPKVRTLADAVGSGAWTRSAAKATRTLKAQRVLEGDDLVKAVAAGTATDTEHLHRVRNADGSLGQYSPERLALHQRIIDNMLQGKGVHPGSAQAIFTAGGPASGKSGLVKTGDSSFERAIGKESTVQMPSDVVHADPDIVRTQLPEYQALVKAGRSDASSLTHEEASFLAKQLTRIALGRQHHILVDTVGDSGPGKFAGKIKDAKRAGHKVSVHYATTDIQTALARAKKR